VDRLNSANKHVFKTKYTSLGVAVEEEDALGNKTYAWHDGLGRVTHTQRDLGNSEAIDTYFGFDNNGNQVTLTDDSSHVTEWAYNARDLVTSITYHDDASRGFTWNADDTLSGWTDENGTEVTNTYDDDGRLTARAIDRAVGVLGPTAEAYSYDGLGRLTQGTNNNSTVQRTYDTFSRLLSETQGPNPLGQSGKTISYTYDDGGNRATCEYFSGYDLVYTPDALGRWQKVEDAQSNDLVTWQFYGPGGRTKRAVHLNGTSENLGYDGYRFVTDVDHKDSVDATFAGFDYAYDAMGNPLYEERTHQSGAGDCYAYDKAYRLTAALIGSSDPSAECADSDWDDYAHAKLTEYQLDDVSNRTSVDTTPYQGQTTYASYTTNSVNEYTVVNSVNRTHDANGNLTAAGSTSLAYDYRNNLTMVEQSQVTLGEYEYDVFNRRTLKHCETERYFYDGFDLVDVYFENGTQKKTIVYGQGIDEPAMLITRDSADLDQDQDEDEFVTLHVHRNMLGSITHVTWEDGEVVESVDYDVYGWPTFRDATGQIISESAIGNNLTYTSREWDKELGLYYYRFRTYDPYTGRFLQRDPLGYVDGANLLEYAGSAPCHQSDPLGLKIHSRGEAFKGTRQDAVQKAMAAVAAASKDDDHAEYSAHISKDADGQYSWDGNVLVDSPPSQSTSPLGPNGVNGGVRPGDITVHAHPAGDLESCCVPSSGDTGNAHKYKIEVITLQIYPTGWHWTEYSPAPEVLASTTPGDPKDQDAKAMPQNAVKDEYRRIHYEDLVKGHCITFWKLLARRGVTLKDWPGLGPAGRLRWISNLGIRTVIGWLRIQAIRNLLAKNDYFRGGSLKGPYNDKGEPVERE
jgi:RHS repeat-associated protein